MLNKILIIYLLLINIIGYIIVALDKQKAIRKKWRISEKTIYLCALFGGSVGVYFSMKTFRHKTKQKRFTIVIPVFFFVNIISFYWLVKILKESII